MKMMKIAPMMLSLAACLLLISCSRNTREERIESLSGDVVIKWNEIAFEAMGGPAYQHSLMASRINAMTHLAMHDAINAIFPEYQTYAFRGSDPEASPEAAAAAAAHEVLLNTIPAKKGFLDSALEKSLLSVADGDAKKRGIALGRQAAQAIIEVRLNDGSEGNPIVKVAASEIPGVYQAVPPMEFTFAPYWENVRLFALDRKDQFRVPPHPPIKSNEYLAAFNEVKEIGSLNSIARTEDKSASARFWYEFSEAGWNRVARTVAVSEDLNLYETARLFALVDMAMADAYIAGWDSKFFYDFWRPYTAIRNASTDGNDSTDADPVWEPSEVTPPVQDYPSTHSALGNAAAAVLSRLLGDNTAFSMTSYSAVPGGSIRSFESFNQAANENADSRVQAGIHFRFSCVAGQKLGTDVGNWVIDHQLIKLP